MFRNIADRWKEFRSRTAKKSFCSEVYHAGYTFLPCGGTLWDGDGAVKTLTGYYGAEKLRRKCMHALFYREGDLGTHDKNDHLSYVRCIIVTLGTPELVREMIEYLKEWRRSGMDATPEGRAQLRQLEVMICMTCKKSGLQPPPNIEEPSCHEEMILSAHHAI